MSRSSRGTLLLLAVVAAACSTDRSTSPTARPAAGPALRLAVPVRVDVAASTVSRIAPSSVTGGASGVSLALVGLNEIGVRTENVRRSTVGQYVAKKVRIQFDVALSSRLQGASLVTPTYPSPPVGEKRLLLFPFTSIPSSGRAWPPRKAVSRRSQSIRSNRRCH